MGDVYFDTEATSANPRDAKFLCGVVLEDGVLVVYMSTEIKKLCMRLDMASRIHVFNQDYDYVLMQCSGATEQQVLSWRRKTVDFFSQVKTALNIWPNLDSIADANGIHGKSSQGGEVLNMTEEEMVGYCGRDVEILAELAAFQTLKIPILTGKRGERVSVGSCCLDWHTGIVSGVCYDCF